MEVLVERDTRDEGVGVGAVIDFGLYAIIDLPTLRRRRLEPGGAVEACVAGGAGIVQLRDKESSGGSLFAAAGELLPICRRLGIPLIINDRVDVALAAGADGVHVGADDLPVAEARRVLGAGAIVGATARTLAEAGAAERDGASYLGIGSLFRSGTKSAPSMSCTSAAEIAAACSIPVVAIGGIDVVGAARLSGLGLAGVAVCSALLKSTDIAAAGRRIRAAFGEERDA